MRELDRDSALSSKNCTTSTHSFLRRTVQGWLSSNVHLDGRLHCPTLYSDVLRPVASRTCPLLLYVQRCTVCKAVFSLAMFTVASVDEQLTGQGPVQKTGQLHLSRAAQRSTNLYSRICPIRRTVPSHQWLTPCSVLHSWTISMLSSFVQRVPSASMHRVVHGCTENACAARICDVTVRESHRE